MKEQTMMDLVSKVADNNKVAPFQNGFVVLSNQEMVKFAELIVQECAELCLKHETMTGPFNRMFVDMGVWSDQAPVEYRKGHHFNTIIKNHFGVEL